MMKVGSVISSLLVSLVLVPLVANSAPWLVSPPQESLTPEEIDAFLQAIEQTPPIPADQAPVTGSFYSAAHGANWPPLPGPMGHSFWSLGNGMYLVNDLADTEPSSLSAMTMSAMDVPGLPGDDGGYDTNAVPMPQFSYTFPTNGLYLFPPTWQQDGSVSLSLFTDQSNEVYDIFYSTNLLNPTWQWIARGMAGQTNWVFANLCPDLGFFIVGTQSHTNGCSYLTDAYLHLVKGSGPCPSSGNNGIPDDWALANGLNPLDPNLGNEDPDDDGFTNLQEYLADTNPLDHMLAAWGDNSNGQSTVPWGWGPVAGMAGGGGASSGGHTLVLTPLGTVLAWGADNFGQTDVPSGLSGVVAVAAGGDQSAALMADGTVVQWGRTYGDVPAGLCDTKAISLGYQHKLALRANGTVVSWGQGWGNSVPTNLSGVKAISAGWNHNLALCSNGTVVVWGLNASVLNWGSSGFSW